MKRRLSLLMALTLLGAVCPAFGEASVSLDALMVEIDKEAKALEVGELTFEISPNEQSVFIDRPQVTGSEAYTIAYNIYDADSNPVNYFYSLEERVAATPGYAGLFNVFVVVTDTATEEQIIQNIGWHSLVGPDDPPPVTTEPTVEPTAEPTSEPTATPEVTGPLTVAAAAFEISEDLQHIFIDRPVITGGSGSVTIAYNIYDADSNPVNYFYSDEERVAATPGYKGHFNVFIVVTDLVTGEQDIQNIGWNDLLGPDDPLPDSIIREGGLIYTRINDGTALSVIGYEGEETVLEIPDTCSGLPVTEIGDGAFRDNTSLTSVTLPGTILRVGVEAFYGCASLRRPRLPIGLKEVDDRAFKGVSGITLWLPRTLKYIGEEAFSDFRYLNVVIGSYAEEWGNALYAQDSSFTFVRYPITNVMVSTEVAMKGEEVTCSLRGTEEGKFDIQWQRSFDAMTWTDCEGEHGEELTFTASAENCGCCYRIVATDDGDTFYSSSGAVGYLGDDVANLDVYVSGTNISVSWGMSWEGITHTLYMTGPDGAQTTVAEGIEVTFCDITGLEPNTAYTFQLKSTYNGTSVRTAPVTVTTQGYRSGTVYRALMVGEVHFGVGMDDCPDSAGDMTLLGNMLQHVTGPQGGAYSCVRKTDLTADQIHEAIRTAFADADEDDVSLFFIASHGLESSLNGDSSYIGALVACNPTLSEYEYIKDTTLAEWLSEIPGEVVVLLEACSSGTAITDPDTVSAPVTRQLAAQNAAVISAFKRADKTLSLDGVQYTFSAEGKLEQTTPKLGGLRRTKFHVLASSAHMEESYAYVDVGYIPHTKFTYSLTQGVGLTGAMPCDTNGDGLASMSELAVFIDACRDPYIMSGPQHVQAYPANSDYALFRRE